MKVIECPRALRHWAIKVQGTGLEKGNDQRIWIMACGKLIAMIGCPDMAVGKVTNCEDCFK